MPRPKFYTSSSIGPAPGLSDNFFDRPEQVVIYIDDAVLDPNDGAFLRVYFMCEPAVVFPSTEEYIIANHRSFDVVLSYSPRVLSACSNAVPLRESNCSWCDRRVDGSPKPFLHNFNGERALLSPVVSNYQSCDVSSKEFAVSFLTSSKGAFPGHVLRQEIYNKLPSNFGNLRVWKHRSPPRWEDKRTTVEPYMFSIAVENSQESGYYSEKLVDCLIGKTVPVYCGSPDVDKYFDPKGILRFSDYQSLEKTLVSLGPELYRSMLPSVEANFTKALQGVHQWSLIEHYIDEGIRKKKDSGYETSSQSVYTNPQPLPRSLRWTPRKSQ